MDTQHNGAKDGNILRTFLTSSNSWREETAHHKFVSEGQNENAIFYVNTPSSS